MEAVFLSSDQCLKEFPENQGGDFCNILNHGFSVASQRGQYMKVSLAELFYIPNSWSNIRPGGNFIDVKITNYPIATHTLQTIYVNKYSVEEKGTIQYLKPSSQTHTATRFRSANPLEPTKVSTESFMRIVRFVSTQSEGCVDRAECEYMVLVIDSARKEGLTYYFDVDPTYYGLGKESVSNHQKIKVSMQSPIYGDKKAKERIFITPKHYYNFDDFAEEFNRQFRFGMARILQNAHPSKKEFHEGYNNLVILTEINGKAAVCIDFEYFKYVSIAIHFAPTLAYILGFSDYMAIDVGWQDKFSDGSHTHNKQQYYTRRAMSPFDFNKNTLRQIYVFCDIIQPCQVGSEQRQLMRILPIDATTNLIPANLFISMATHRVIKDRINIIRIWITEHLNSPPLKLRDTVFVKLIFELANESI